MASDLTKSALQEQAAPRSEHADQIAAFLDYQAARPYREADGSRTTTCDLCSRVFAKGFFDGKTPRGDAFFCVSCALDEPLFSSIELPKTSYLHWAPTNVSGRRMFVCLAGLNFEQKPCGIKLKTLVEHFGSWDKAVEKLLEVAAQQKREDE
jgi:hypothetical protein